MKRFTLFRFIITSLLFTVVMTAMAGDPVSDSVSPFVGKWTYRSWINDPEPVDVGSPQDKADKMARLLFAEAEMIIDSAANGEVHGKLLMGSAGSLTLFGSAGYGSPFAIRIQGVGKEPGSVSEGWVYDYIGWLVPAWPNGVDQRPAIVGSVVRTVPHSNGQEGWQGRLLHRRAQRLNPPPT